MPPADQGTAAAISGAGPEQHDAPARVSDEAPGRRVHLHGAGDAPKAPATDPDPVASAHFKNLILNLATSAAASLGEIPHPDFQQTEVDLEGARQLIDLLQALKVKTRANLNQEEAALLDSLLYDLQMKFVSLQSKTPKRP